MKKQYQIISERLCARTMTEAVVEAMEDYLEGARPHNPAIMHRHDAGPECGYYYGSALHDDDIVVNVEDGFGSWTPESPAEIQVCAEGFAAEYSDFDKRGV